MLCKAYTVLSVLLLIAVFLDIPMYICLDIFMFFNEMDPEKVHTYVYTYIKRMQHIERNINGKTTPPKIWGRCVDFVNIVDKHFDTK
jgi:hypothetical protein